MKPDWRLLVSHPAHFFSLGFGSGLMPKGPGTAGTLVAFPLYWGLAPLMNDYLFLLFLLLAFIIGISICDKTGRALGVPDHGGIVWDEIVAFMLVLFFTPAGIYWQILAFVLFRFFDIVKPQPIKYFDQNMHGGLGVMFDDLLAAGYALLCLAFIKSMMA
ncbi:MAG: phosphatidylglycerophosphatase A [Gallionellales bacterium 35-53-114]|nr:MAG: phosphatidylglycerophosphatase A [Gallionellales bacterium 35-53-114]OYZ62303.1 MAG: phosphatidylglycerophosphatase A [Gallionellales bacterium 24-53-125]OZB10693.1 MAG: phosphatidylglycerophosphatase A [Gallionellales bacterium 39-52-133]